MKLFSSLIIIAFASMFLAAAVQAGEENREEKTLSSREIAKLIDFGMPEYLTENNVELVAAMLNPKLGDSLSKKLNLDVVAEEFFEGKKTNIEGNCYDSRFDLKNCELSAGDAAGKGAFSKLSLRHDHAKTSLRFAKRPEQREKPEPVELSDARAYKQALRLFTETIGVSELEIPVAPVTAKNRYPVKTVNLAASRGKGAETIIPVQKLVNIQRGLYVDKLGWIPGPGQLAVSFNSEGINAAVVRSWADMSEYGRELNAKNAKSRSQLVEELSDLLQKEGIGKLDSANSLLAVSLPSGAESPMPVLRVYASAQADDLSEEEQARVVSSAGVVFEIPLIHSDDSTRSSDDS